MARLFYPPQAVRVDSSGLPYPGAKANFYLTTTTTKTDTYTDNALGTPHANPVVADAAGQFAAIFLDPAVTYRCIITDTDDVQLDDVDPVHVPFTAADVAIVDSGGYYVGTDLETILADIGLNYPKNATTETISAVWTWSANIEMADNLIIRPEIKDYSLTHTAITSSSNAITADCADGNSFYHLLTENTTFTLSNPSPTGKYCVITIEIQQDGGGGAYTVAWPAGDGTSTPLVKWAGGSGPTISVGNNAIDKIVLSTRDAGLNWLGDFSQAYA